MPLVGQTGLTVANVPGAFQQGQSNAMDMQIKRAQMQEIQRQAQQKQQQNALARQASGLPSLGQQAKVPLTEDQAMAELLIRNPEMGNDIFKRLGANSQQQRDDAALFAFRASGLNEERQDAFLNQRIKEVEGRGGDSSQSKELLALPYADRQRDLKALQIASLNAEQRQKIATGQSEIKVSNITEAAGGGFIGVKELPGGKFESMFIPPVIGKRTKGQVDAHIKREGERIADKMKAGKEQFARAKDLRSEISKVSSDFNKIESAFGRIEVSAKDPSAAGDLALIFNFMKMLDPGSVVRESEFATAANAAGVPDRIRANYNKVMNGERLAIKQRSDFVGKSQALYKRAVSDNKRAVSKIVDIGEQFGVSRGELLGREKKNMADIDVSSLSSLTIEELESMVGGK